MASLLKLGIDQVKLNGKKVLLRTDLNVEMRNGHVVSFRRLMEGIPTMKYILEKGGALILISHIGRPNGRFVPQLSLSPFAEKISKRLHRPVEFLSDCMGSEVKERCAHLKPGEVILLENLRFHNEETGNDVSKDAVEQFRNFLSSLADVYVQDAFATMHRTHSSIIGIDIPIRAAGLLMMKELDYFSEALESPQRPLLAIIGGSSLMAKKDMIRHLITKVDMMIIAGAPAFTMKKFLNNIPIGSSVFNEDLEPFVKEIEASAIRNGVKLYFPVDYVIADRFAYDGVVDFADDSTGIPPGMMALDIGVRSRLLFKSVVEQAATVIWNGPLGVYEFGKFAVGTKSLMDSLVETSSKGSTVIVCGVDTCQACRIWGTEEKLTHVSTGDAVSSLVLSGKVLPGVEALSLHPHKHLIDPARRKKEDGVVIDDAVKAKLTKWHKKTISMTGKFRYYVAVDVGASHTRVVIGISGSKFITITRFQATDVTTLLNGFQDVASQVTESLGGVQAFGAALDVAGRVFQNGTKVDLVGYSTGTESSIRISTEDLPSFLFPLGRTRFLNDVEAACFGIMKLSQDNQISEYFATMSKKDPYHPALSSSSSFSSSSSTSSSPSFVSSSSSSSSSSSVCRCSPCRCSPCQHSTCPRFSVSSCSSPPISSSSSNSGRRSINLQPFNNYLVCWVGKGLGSGVIRFVKGEMREVIPLEAGHMYVTPLGGEDSSKVFDDDITSYLSERIYGANNPIEWEDVCCGRGVANCFAAIEHHKTGREIPLLSATAGSVQGRALTAQRTMEHQKRLVGEKPKIEPGDEDFLGIWSDSAEGKQGEGSEEKEEQPKASKIIFKAMKRIRAKLPGPMKYAHDSLKTHYRYLARFSQQLSITFRADAVFWVGDNQVYNQNFISALADDLLAEFSDHPKGWLEDVPILSQTKSMNINLLGVLFAARMIAKDAQIAEDLSQFTRSLDQMDEYEQERSTTKSSLAEEKMREEGSSKIASVFTAAIAALNVEQSASSGPGKKRKRTNGKPRSYEYEGSNPRELHAHHSVSEVISPLNTLMSDPIPIPPFVLDENEKKEEGGSVKGEFASPRQKKIRTEN